MPSFNPNRDIPDLSGKVILVTGGNNGLGKETVLQLSKHNPAHIFLGARSEAKALKAINEIRRVAPESAKITFLQLDLASLQSVKQAATSFLAQSSQLHLLINNAGIMATPPGTTKDGYEEQFGTNHMGHALLTQLLLPTLKDTATATAPPQDVRIITLSSLSEAWAPPAETYSFDKLKTDFASISTSARYGISKIANVHYAAELARHHPEIRSVSVHPGLVNTGLMNSITIGRPYLKPIIPIVGLFVTQVAAGARNQLWAATSNDAKSGEFYHPVGVSGKGSELSKSERLAKELWEWTNKELAPYL
ncbi:retinol dehydrogenase [Pyrenochaeta sp. DS3sAY3a]|nr:retinol dehydrogenase [Pyrenochaeta sp. DS3sAY3a]